MIMDSAEIEVKKEVNCNNAFQTATVENEPHTIGVFVKCEGCNTSSGAISTDFVDNEYANFNYQELNEEKVDAMNHCKALYNSSVNECKTGQVKRDEDRIVLYKDIKSESGEEQSSELFSFCEACIKGFGSGTDEISEFQCTCHEQNEALYDEQTVDDIEDVKPSLLAVSTDSGLQKLKVKEEKIFVKLASSAIPQKNYKRRTPTNNSPTKSPESYPLAKHQEGKPFLCNICSKSFRHSYDLKVHQRIHTGEKPFQCNICSKSFSRKGSLIVHQKIHTGEKPHCKICSKSFTYYGALTIHERTHTGEKPFKCNNCPKAFTNSKNLRVHARIHSGEKPFRCKVCSKSFSQKGSLNYHEKTHTGEKSFHCKVCSKAFTNSSHLKIHERIHTGEKPFCCKICLKTFNSSSHLRGHERMHTGEKPYVCETCSKSFCHKRSLTIHGKIHLLKKPHSCKFCSKSFCRKSSLGVHEKIHTDEKPVSKSSQS